MGRPTASCHCTYLLSGRGHTSECRISWAAGLSANVDVVSGLFCVLRIVMGDVDCDTKGTKQCVAVVPLSYRFFLERSSGFTYMIRFVVVIEGS